MKRKNIDLSSQKNRIIKNLNYDIDTGRFTLIDNQNNGFVCDMFGRQKNTFKRNITGISNRYQLKPLFIEDANEKKKTLSPLHYSNNNIMNPKNFKTIENKKSINYHPFRRRFDEAYGLPKSLVVPFFNEKEGDLKEKNKRELIEHLKTYFSNYHNVSIKNENDKCALSYITCDLNDNKLSLEDNKKLIKLIDNTILKYREEYKFKLNILYKNPVVKALKKFKNYIILNQGTNVIDGYKLNETKEEIKDKFEIIKTNIKNYYPKALERRIINEKKIEAYRNKNYFSINKNINIENEEKNIYEQINKYNVIVGPDKLNNICQSKDFTIGRLLEMDFGLNEEDKKIKLNRIKRLGNSAFKGKNNNIAIKNRHIKLSSGLKRFKNSNMNNSKNSNDEQMQVNSSRVEMTYKDTIETLSNKDQNINNININYNNNNSHRTLEQKIADNDLSFISELSEKEKKIAKKNIFKIKSFKLQRELTDTENRLLKGYQKKEEIKKEKSSLNKRPYKLKSFLECYKNDINLLKKTNPVAYNLQKKEEERELMLMKKKNEITEIFERNKTNNK